MTLVHLCEIGACEPARRWFREEYGEGAGVPLSRVLRDAAEHERGPEWVWWYADGGHLPLPAEEAYAAAVRAAILAAADALDAAEVVQA